MPRGAAPGLAVAGVVTQIAYPLTSGRGAVIVTVLSVVLLAAAAVAHVLETTGSAWPSLVLVVAAGGTGLLAEAIGVRTGFPFGSYRYTSLLGPSLAGVPLLVPLAWTMLGYPCLLLGRRLAGASPLRTAVLGGLALASWDLFLDPQLVALDAWRWRHPEPGLPGVPGVPLTNYAGWVLVSIILVAVLDRVLRLPGLTAADQLVPAAVLTWTWLGSAIGNLAFFGRPAVALYGGVTMGRFVAPYLASLRSPSFRLAPGAWR